MDKESIDLYNIPQPARKDFFGRSLLPEVPMSKSGSGMRFKNRPAVRAQVTKQRVKATPPQSPHRPSLKKPKPQDQTTHEITHE